MNGSTRIGAILFVFLVYSCLVLGCGRKGDLYVPDRSAGYNQQDKQQNNQQNASLFTNKI